MLLFQAFYVGPFVLEAAYLKGVLFTQLLIFHLDSSLWLFASGFSLSWFFSSVAYALLCFAFSSTLESSLCSCSYLLLVLVGVFILFVLQVPLCFPFLYVCQPIFVILDPILRSIPTQNPDSTQILKACRPEEHDETRE